MQTFLGPDFLLDTAMARHLYHDVAVGLPIVDYHNHLIPEQIANDKKWETIGEVWLAGDHYKWRAMRWAGIPEEKCSGAASYREKFDAFAEVMPKCFGNPLYHWTHLELQRYFGIDELLSPKTADHDLGKGQMACWLKTATQPAVCCVNSRLSSLAPPMLLATIWLSTNKWLKTRASATWWLRQASARTLPTRSICRALTASSSIWQRLSAIP